MKRQREIKKPKIYGDWEEGVVYYTNAHTMI